MWSVKKFSELSIYELQEIYALRVKVFVVEQNCAYQEVDDLDLHSIHLFKKENNKIITYARLIPEEAVIHLGRVVVHPDYRKSGKAHELLKTIINYYEELYGNLPLKAQAQAYLEKFYSSFGFHPVSEVYLEDGIPHIDMIRNGGRIHE